MWRSAQLAKHFPRVREIGNFVEYRRRERCLTWNWRRLFLGRPAGGLERNSNHIKTSTMEGNIMKKSMLILACAAIAPFAFAQTSTTTTESTTTKKNPVTTESTTTTSTTMSDGTVTTFEPGKTIVVRRSEADGPVSYALGKTVRFLNRAGAEIKAERIKAGTRVHVYYSGNGDTRTVERVVVDEN
jgi:hypothetical protein